MKDMSEEDQYPDAEIRIGGSLIYIKNMGGWIPISADDIEYVVLRDTRPNPVSGYGAFWLKRENKSMWVCMEDSGIMPEDLADCLGMEISSDPSRMAIVLRRRQGGN